MDEQWALDQLLAVLPAIKSIECDTHVVQRLAELSKAHSYQTVHALRLMAEKDEHGWRMGLRRAEARAVLESALRSGLDSAEREAINLINYFAAKSDRQFVDLLNNSE